MSLGGDFTLASNEISREIDANKSRQKNAAQRAAFFVTIENNN